MENFARELRSHCARLGSIARVCKETGINRQQFNKYLAGQMLPGARTLRKICTCLGVTEEQLMAGVRMADRAITPRSPGIAPEALPAALAGCFGAKDGQRVSVPGKNRLPDGLYDCYFPVHGRSGLLVRWVLQLRPGAHGQVFTCRTQVRDPGMSHRAVRLKYDGVLMYGAREACLIGAASMPLHHPGLMSVNTVPVLGRTYFSALALARRLDGQLALMAAMHFRGANHSRRQALGDMGLIALDDPALDPVITRMMQAAPASGSNWMQSVSGKNLRSNTSSPATPRLPEALTVRRLSV